MMRRKEKVTALGVAAVALAVAGHAQAGIVNYGNFTGPNVEYTNVTENDTQIPGPTPPFLFGTPTLSGNNLVFNTTDFSVSASGAGTSEFQDGRLSSGIVAIAPPPGITSLELNEGGAWDAINGGTNTYDEASLLVNSLFITAVNGVTLGTPIVVPPVYTESAPVTVGDAIVSTSPGNVTITSGGDFSDGTWNIDAEFNIAGALAAHSITGQATGLSITLDNQIYASSDAANALAFIDKKFFQIVPSQGPSTPEPTSLGLLAGAGLLALRRRKA